MTLTVKGGSQAGLTGFAATIRIGLAAAPAYWRAYRNRRQAYRLSELPDYLLSDLGLRRDDVHEALAADWRQDATYRLAIRAAKRRRGF